jgi:hypothetical protein
MHLLLLAIGVLVTAVGVVMLAFSVPLTDLAGVALFTSGMIAAVGGFILIGLSAAVRSLSRIAERFDIQPLPLPSVVAVEHEAPAPRPIRAAPEPPVAATATVSEPKPFEPKPFEPKPFEAKPFEAKASEVLRAPEAPKPGDTPKAPEPIAARGALLGWFGRPKGPATPNPGAQAEVASVRAAAQNGAQNGASDGPAADLGALARPPEPLQAPERFPSVVTRGLPAAPPQVAAEPAPAIAAPPPVRPAPRPAPPPAQAAGAPQNGTAATTVYRSGVIDGMAYSLFMDGSIEAELPTGRVKFGTIDELQKYLVSRR